MGKILIFLGLFFLTAACQNKPEQYLTEAQAQLAKSDYTKAAASASAGLALQPSDARLRWRLEFLQLEALARGGNSPAAIASIERLAQESSTQIRSSHYVSTADQLRNANQAAAAVQLLDKGLKRFPKNAAISKSIQQAKASEDDDELKALKSLGYLGD